MAHDDDEMPEKIFSNTQVLADAMTMVQGTTLFVKDTGHSIPTERPVFFAGQILDFLYRAPAAAVRIKTIYFNPPGRDIEREYVEIQNDTAGAVGMEAWTLRDRPEPHVHVPGVRAPGRVQREGVDKERESTMRRISSGVAGSAVWNNKGDKAVLRDENGADVARYAY